VYTSNGKTVVLAEREVEVANFLEMALRFEGFEVKVVREGEDLTAAVSAADRKLAAVLVDIPDPLKDGVETLRRVRCARPDLPVIVFSGNPAPEAVVRVMRCGAVDFLAKPLTHGGLIEAVRGATAARAPKPARIAPLEAENPTMRSIAQALDRIALSDVPVVLRGETGVGKEVLAREIHARSPRAQKPLLKINCAAVPLELLESELFGYERGAFTGALKSTPGKFETADGGTILLDRLDAATLEQAVRGLLPAVGTWAAVALHSCTVAEAARYAVPGSISRALSVGSAAGPAPGRRPVGAGTVVQVRRDGASRGGVLTLDLDEDAGVLRVDFSDEHVLAVHDGMPVAWAPDIIALVDERTGRAVTVDALRPGQHLTLSVLPAPAAVAQRADLLGPAAYGLLGWDE